MKTRQRWLEAILLTGASVGLTLVGFECGLRSLSAPPAPDPDAGLVEQLYQVSEDPEVGFEHRRGVHLVFPARGSGDRANPAWELRTDGNGIRSNGRGDPLASELRGVCLGDSTTFGAGLSDGETVPAQLSEIVSGRLGRRFECLNLGVSNYTTRQEVALFRRMQALRFDPRVVVLGVYTNDFKVEIGRIDSLDGQVRLLAPDAPAWLTGPLGSLRLAQLAAAGTFAVRDWLRRIGVYPQANAKPLRPEEIGAVYDALDQLRAMLEPRGIPLVLLLFPRDWQLGARDREAATERQRRVLAYCRRHQLRCVDLLDRFWGRPIGEYFRPGDDSHPHAQAARVAAEQLADAVVEALR
jgi:lysophospholipase L1-like esterase